MNNLEISSEQLRRSSAIAVLAADVQDLVNKQLFPDASRGRVRRIRQELEQKDLTAGGSDRPIAPATAPNNPATCARPSLAASARPSTNSTNACKPGEDAAFPVPPTPGMPTPLQTIPLT